MHDLVSGLAQLVWPPSCAACGEVATGLLCVRCQRSLPWIDGNSCCLCQERPRVSNLVERCFPCFKRRRPLQACVAGVLFEGEPASWIRDFKYASPWSVSLNASKRARIRVLAQSSIDHVPGGKPDAILPIPLHPSRLRTRGFNPAMTIAREVTRCASAPVLHRLVRTRDTPSQTGLGRRERRRNVSAAFAVRGKVPRRIWLVDDVVTTGATLESAARALRLAGATEIIGVCLARTPLSGKNESLDRS